jgi:hypothetical protein
VTILAAVYRSPSEYALAADTGVSNGHGGLWIPCPSKIVTLIEAGKSCIGFLGFAGPTNITDRWRRMLDEKAGPGADLVHMVVNGGAAFHISARLAAMHDAVLPHAGPAAADSFPRTAAAILLVCPPGIFALDQHGAIHTCESWWAEGTGAEVALGYLDAIERFSPGHAAKDRAREAAEASCFRMSSCRGPVHVESLP